MIDIKVRRGFEVTFLLLIIVVFTILLVVPTKLPLNNANIDLNETLINNTLEKPFYAKVTRIIDGDTFVIDTGDKVRLICIDAPELGKKGAEDSISYIAKLILSREVKLVKDVNDKDQYGRLLRYVYVEKAENTTFVNKEMVKNGYAAPFRYGNDTKFCDEISGK